MNQFHFIHNDINNNYIKKGLKYIVKLLINSQTKIALCHSNNIFTFDGITTMTWSREKIILDYCDELLQKRASRLKIRQWLSKILYKEKFINNQDLYFNNLDKDTFSISTNMNIYRFTLEELVNILNNSLGSYDENGFITPKFPKNPYTNIEFNQLDIKNIYKYIESRSKLCDLFILFKISNFNIQIFAQQQCQYLTYRASKLIIKEYRFSDKIKLLNDIYQEQKGHFGYLFTQNSKTLSFLRYNKHLLNQLLTDFYINKQFGDIFGYYYYQKYYKNYKYLIRLYKDFKSIKHKKRTHKSRKNKPSINKKKMDNYIDNIFTFSQPITLDTDPKILSILNDISENYLNNTTKYTFLQMKPTNYTYFTHFNIEYIQKLYFDHIYNSLENPIYPLLCPKYHKALNKEAYDELNSIPDLEEIIILESNEGDILTYIDSDLELTIIEEAQSID